MSRLQYFRYFLWYFGFWKVPLIGFLRPKLIKADDNKVIIQVPLRRRSKNHLNSMYFGALAVGADLAGGLHGYYYAQKLKLKISLVFKSFAAQFIKRPESDVYFICTMGKDIQEMIEKAAKTSTRINKPIQITAYTNYPEQPIAVANFTLELSLKVKQT